MTIFKVASFFAGVGGIDGAFEKTGRFKTVYANEIDPYPAETFQKNFSIPMDVRDIHKVDSSDVPDVDVMTGGFPCQAFSIAGYRQGFHDEKGRGTLFFELMRFIREKRPRAVFLENVKNLVGHDNGNTFRVILESLEEEGYHTHFQVLNAMEYGNLPQNRERIYIVSFREKEDFSRFRFPEPIALTRPLEDVIDFFSPMEERYYYSEGKYKGPIYESLVEAMDDPRSIYQWRRKYVRKNKSGVVPTLTANMGEGGHNVPIILSNHGIRKLTPHECFNIQGFPKDFILPNLSESRLYKQAGNSVCVEVVRRIAKCMADAFQG